ncbi:MAG TPA: hypothetical protein VGG48_09955 [Rhizomicrobium sp.]|jgi:hypothetical protein
MKSENKKRDLRDGMLEKGPVGGVISERGTVVDFNRGDPEIVSPGIKPQAEGQTTHE